MQIVNVPRISIQDRLVSTPQVLEGRGEAGAIAWTVYEMANRQRPRAEYQCWAQEARQCVSARRRDFSQGVLAETRWLI